MDNKYVWQAGAADVLQSTCHMITFGLFSWTVDRFQYVRAEIDLYDQSYKLQRTCCLRYVSQHTVACFLLGLYEMLRAEALIH